MYYSIYEDHPAGRTDIFASNNVGPYDDDGIELTGIYLTGWIDNSGSSLSTLKESSDLLVFYPESGEFDINNFKTSDKPPLEEFYEVLYKIISVLQEDGRYEAVEAIFNITL